MLKSILKGYHIILASGSPRRQAFFKALDLDYTIQLKPVNEVFPKSLKGAEISDYLALLKAKAFEGELEENDILITSDTIVWHKGKALGKPKEKAEAIKMLQDLSGSVHEVITSVCLTNTAKQITINDSTKVHYNSLSIDEIEYYVEHYKPFDKAGGYGIQEWIGAIGISHIEGSYNNVVGLPTQKLYETLKRFAQAP